MRVTVVGDALLDRDLDGQARRLAPDAPVPVVDRLAERARPGGAGLAAVLAARAGADVALVTALADDEAGRTLVRLIAEAGVAVHAVPLAGETAEKVRVLAGGRPVVRLDRGGSGAPGALTGEARAAIASADAVLVSDYGLGLTSRSDVRAALARRPVVWDPHPRGAEPTPGALLVTPNAAEAAHFAPGLGDEPEACGRALLERWRAVAVCVTRGAAGALLLEGGRPALAIPARAVSGDPCGAGDCFAASAAVAIAGGALPTAAVGAAVGAASAFVAAGGAGAIRPGKPAPAPGDDPFDVVARVRAQGGTVVATGGCFDLLHAGHVRTLEAARAQGDCLVVLVNSDASVRRLKGGDRPLVGEADRVAVLRALKPVDAVIVFGEDEPSRALERLRPDIWVKGGDYALSDLAEADALASWGGRIVLVPYVAGRSTTRLIEEAVARAS